MIDNEPKTVEAIAPATNAGALNGDYISLKHAVGAFVNVHITQGNAATCALTLYQATDVSGTSAKALANAVPIWANQDCAASDTLTSQTRAVSFTTSAAVKHKIVRFWVPVSELDVANSFDCLQVRAGASNASNIVAANYQVVMKYGGDNSPTTITD